jgi:predicted GH43/DUF377 family glycosyl hydrolase
MIAYLLPSVFTIEIDGKPILSFEAINLREAYELCHERWLKSDLLEATSAGVPLWDGKTKLRARIAMEDEAAKVALAAQSIEPSDGLLLVYHVELDEGSDGKLSDDTN